jgi:hypothetical protein
MSTPQHAPLDENPATADRRRSPRVEVLGRIAGESGPAHVRVTLLNMSRSGFMMQSSVNHPLGHILEFRFTVAEEESIVLRGRVVHVMRTTGAHTTSYISGLEFVDRDTPDFEDTLQALLNRLDS